MPNPARTLGSRQVVGDCVRGPILVRRSLSIFSFARRLPVFGVRPLGADHLGLERGYTIVHSLQYTFLILLLTPIGGVVGGLFPPSVLNANGSGSEGRRLSAVRLLFALSTPNGADLASGRAGHASANNWFISVFHPTPRVVSETHPVTLRSVFFRSLDRVSAIFVGYWVSAILAAWGQVERVLMWHPIRAEYCVHNRTIFGAAHQRQRVWRPRMEISP